MRGAAPLILYALLAGCGGPSTPESGPRDARDAAREGGACSPLEAPLGGSCWSAEGTRWRVHAEGPGGAYRFDLALLAAGRARADDHDGASPVRDEWFQDGSLLRVFLGDRFVEYRTRVTNGTVLIGEAINVRGQRWSFRADRDFSEAPCAVSEARLDAACMTVAGTRWELDGRVVAFLDEGRVAVDAAAEASGRWTQAGAALTFTLADGAPAHVARIDDATALSGTFEGRDGSWSATLVASLPPVMHE